MVISPFQVRVHLTPAKRAEAIDDSIHSSMQQSPTHVCAFEDRVQHGGVVCVGTAYDGMT
jgi:hypothetical protein